MRTRKNTNNIVDINSVDIKDYSFWFGQPGKIYDGTEVFTVRKDGLIYKKEMDAWEGYDQTMVDHTPVSDDNADHNLLLGYRKSEEDIVPVKLATNSYLTGKNSNVLLIGGSGTGKTFKYILPNIAQMDGSYIILDPHGDIYENMAKLLMENGYNVLRFDPSCPERSNVYNPLDYVYDADGRADYTKVSCLVDIILYDDTKAAQKSDPFWEQSMKTLLIALIMYVADFYPKNQRDLFHVAQLFKSRADETSDQILDRIMEVAKDKHPGAKCFEYYDVFSMLPEKTRKSIVINIGLHMFPFVINEVKYATSMTPEVGGIDLNTLNTRKTALFIIGNPKAIPNVLTSMLLTQSMHCLVKEKPGAWAIVSNKLPLYCSLDSKKTATKLLDKYLHAHVQAKIVNKTTYYYICDAEGKVIEGVSSKEAGEKLLERFKKAEIIEDNKKFINTKIIIDEFANIACLPKLPEQMTIARKYHVSYMLVVQTLSQLRDRYSQNTENDKDSTKANYIIDSCDIVIYLGSPDMEYTNKYISDLCRNTLVPVKTDADRPLAVRVEPLISAKDILKLSDCIVCIRGLNPMRLNGPSFDKHPMFNNSGMGNLECKLSDKYLTGYYKGLFEDRNIDDTEKAATDTYKDVPLNNPMANHKMITLLENYCSDDMCKEPTKHCVGTGNRTSLDNSLDYIKYGKHINMYQCENIACPHHPNHQITINELARFLKLKTPDKVSKKDILGAVLDIIEK